MKTAELPPRCARTRKATSWFGLGLFSNTISYSRELHEDECEGLSGTSIHTWFCFVVQQN